MPDSGHFAEASGVPWLPAALPASWGLLRSPASPGHRALRGRESRRGREGGATGPPWVFHPPRKAEDARGLTPRARPAAPGGSVPRAPALRRCRAAHPPPLGNVNPGRGGRGSHECACAPGLARHRPRQSAVRRAPSAGRVRGWGLFIGKLRARPAGCPWPDPTPPG